MDNDLAQVIDRTFLIENLMDQIIEKYISPRKESFSFFRNIFLDSSIISLGTKVKLVLLISNEMNLRIDDSSIRTVVRLRNAFAHHGLHAHPVFIVGKTPDEDKSLYELQTITSSLKIKRVSREKGLEEFNEAYQTAKNTLIILKQALEEKISNGKENVSTNQ